MADPAAVIVRHDRMRKEFRANRKILLWTGVGLIVLGALAAIFPTVSTLVTEQVIGWLFVAGAVAVSISAFTLSGVGPKAAGVLLAVIMAVLGLLLVFEPVSGIYALTFALAALFLADAIYRGVNAFAMRPMRGWGWQVLAGIASLALALVIVFGLPETGTFTLGLVVGLYFIAVGVAMTAIATALKRELESAGVQ